MQDDKRDATRQDGSLQDDKRDAIRQDGSFQDDISDSKRGEWLPAKKYRPNKFPDYKWLFL